MKKHIGKIVLTIVIAATFVTGAYIFGKSYASKEYVVSFDTDGGTLINDKIVFRNSVVVKPTNPTKEGYKFLYWSLDGKEFDFKTPIKRDITLVAIYEKVTSYTVWFDTDSDSGVNSVKVDANKAVKAPLTPKKEGYKFLYWSLDGKKYDFNTKVNKNITLIAKWEKLPLAKADEKPADKINITYVKFESGPQYEVKVYKNDKKQVIKSVTTKGKVKLLANHEFKIMLVDKTETENIKTIELVDGSKIEV